jgi:DNA-binding Xre family transcriptional regulator
MLMFIYFIYIDTSYNGLSRKFNFHITKIKLQTTKFNEVTLEVMALICACFHLTCTPFNVVHYKRVKMPMTIN